MDLYSVIKTIHILSACILFGTGAGIAFFMFRSKYTDSLPEKYYAVRNTVLADFIFTLPVVIIQPISGFMLVSMAGFDPMAPWLVASYALYILAGICWLPVVAIQIKLSRMLKAAVQDNTPLPPNYHRLFNIWFYLGWPAFLGLIVIFGLMVSKTL